ncbi:MAG: serine hydroxymethyltransferase [Caedibacter sp. 38-128]|mgnify:CR=1 FL=1|nr:serine hydroxymethyltransferase [Holosporales bacterium]OJX07973.1 MAG: serine hydroxymethyltransferase [Caedibacter sp. 38-128]
MTEFKFLPLQDNDVFNAIEHELHRQQNQLEMIASENFVSPAVLEAQGCIMTNKYAEGYPGRRYYGGCTYVDQVETLAIERAKQLFNCTYVNVQPHSGSQANQAVFLALLQPGDTFLGMDLNCGGHLTHGSPVNLSGKWFNAVSYPVHKETHLLDYEIIEELALKHKPKLIIAGGSAYPRTIDFARFRKIADQIGAYLMVDMAHFAGLVAGGVFPSPLPHAHVVTTTTHKTLRGPRGGMILSNDLAIGKKLNSAIFPGAQGGPLMHIIAAKAVAFKEALSPAFKQYAEQVVKNAKTLVKALNDQGFNITTQGTDCHLLLVDLQQQKLTGQEACDALEHAGITCNKNGIPFDPLPPLKTSGIRLGSPALTTRGMKEAEFETIGFMIAELLKSLQQGDIETTQPKIRQKVAKLCQSFPLYKDF